MGNHSNTGPLSHLRVLDMSRVLAGPWASQNLSDLGAEVIKIERPIKGDDTRAWGPPFLKNEEGEDTRETAYFLCANRGKKSLTVDIASQAGQDLIKKLVVHCDVLIENYKSGDLPRYGLSYEDLKKINPNLIYCSITGFGQDGPFHEQAGYDFMIQATGGLMSLTGAPDDEIGGGPQKVGVPVADLMTGMYATVGILAALTRRDREGGGGEHVDMALLDCQIAMLSNQAQNFLISKQRPKRYGNAHPNVVPYQSFATSNGHIIVAIGNDFQFGKYCHAIGAPQLITDPLFSTNAGRVINRKELIPILAPLMLKHSTEEWLEILGPLGVPCGPINSVDQVFEHPQAIHREMKLEMDHPVTGKIPMVANPIHFKEHPITYQSPPPLLGEHNQDVLENILGLSKSEIESLQRQGTI